MRERVFWLLRAVQCFFKGHDDGATFFNPSTGTRDLGFTCYRCGRPRLNKWEEVLRRN